MLHGAPGDIRSDIYSLRRVLEWLLTDKDPDQLRPRTSPRGNAISDDGCDVLDSIVARATALDPDDRFTSVRSMSEAVPSFWVTPRPQPLIIPEDLPATTETNVYGAALAYARNDDSVGWNQLESSLRRSYSAVLNGWRQDVEGRLCSEEDVLNATDRLLDGVFPRLLLPLAAVASGSSSLTDPRRCIDDLLSPADWRTSGQTILVAAPRAMAYVFHVLFGAVCLDRGRPEEALQMAFTRVADRAGRNELRPLWRTSDVAAYPELLLDCKTAWNYVSSLRDRHPALEDVFALQRDFKIALASYSMLLSVAELATYGSASSSTYPLNFPPMFAIMGTETILAASARVILDPRTFALTLDACGAKRETVVAAWPAWRARVQSFAKDVTDGFWLRDEVPIPDPA